MPESDSQRPQDPLEAASYDLKKFRERRVADRRFMPRGTADRRASTPAAPAALAPSGPDEG